MDTTLLHRAANQADRLQPKLGWLQGIRRQALERVVSEGFPTVAEEDWRYTDLRPAIELARRHFSSTPPVGAMRSASTLTDRLVAELTEGRTVFVDGSFQADLSRIPKAQGLTIVPLSQAAPSSQRELAGRIGRAAVAGNALAALNTALLHDGLLIEVAPGVALEKPIYVVVGNTADGSSYNRILVTLGPGSRATFIEHHVGMSESLSNSVSEFACDRGSRLSYVKLQAEDASAVHLASQRFSMAGGARADIVHLDLGSRLARNDLHVDLSGDGAEVIAHGLFYADGARHLDNHTRIDHQAAHSRSREHYRGIVDGNGRGVFNGKVVVHPGAVKADAQLTNRNLLLSSTAEIDTKPELEIYADDVKCAHGATTGQLNEDSIFYLRSRGIAHDQARRMLIASFAREVVKRVPSAPLQRYVLTLLQDKLPNLAEMIEFS